MNFTQLSAASFIENLIDSRLMSANRARQWLDDLSACGEATDGQAVANGLVQRGELTEYQSQILSQIRPHPLIFDGFEVLDRLGSGNMGVVCKAVRRSEGLYAAIKILASSASMSPTILRRFQREGKTAFKMNHENIVSGYSVGEVDGVHYLAMELVDGTDLDQLVETKGPVHPFLALNYFVQAACGLRHAHSQGVIHRDVKPANLLLSHEGEVKVVDLGLAAIKEGHTGSSLSIGQLTQDGQSLGTADYMAPEQAVDTHSVDHRADIYALGCTWHFLLTGLPPYQGDTITETLMAHHEAPIPSLIAAGVPLPPEYDTLFQRLLAKNPNERFASFDDVFTALEACPEIAAPFGDTTTNVRSQEPKSSPASDATVRGTAPEKSTWNSDQTVRGTIDGDRDDAVTDDPLQELMRQKQLLAEFLESPEGDKPATSAAPPLASTDASPQLPPPAPLPRTDRKVNPSAGTVHASPLEDTSRTPAWKEFDPLKATPSIDRDTARWVLQLGGAVEIGSDQQSKFIHWTSDLPATKYDLLTVDFRENQRITQRDLAKLVGLERLRKLILNGAAVGAGAMQSIGQLPSLLQLELQRTAITDDSLYYLVKLNKLLLLDLKDTSITHYAVDYLVHLTNLRELILPAKDFPQGAVQRLQQALTHCDVLLR